MPARRVTALAVVLSLLGPAAAPLAAQTLSPALTRKVDAWYKSTQHRTRGRWGIAIADERGAILWSHLPDQPLIPASTVKIFTTGYAETRLGGDARRATRVRGVGLLDSATGTWNGTWTLELNGDPSFEDPHHVGPRLFDLASQLAHAGIRRLVGPLSVSSEAGPATATFPSSWPTRHRGAIFAPPIGPLTVHENIISIWVAPSNRSGRRPRLVNDAPAGVTALVTNDAVTRAGRRSKLSLSARRDGWVLRGWIGSRAGLREVKAVAYDPELVVQVAWAQALRQAGVAWAPSAGTVLAPNDGRDQVLAEVFSPTLDSLAADIDRRSLNLGAELLLLWAAGSETPAESLSAHIEAVTGIHEGLQLFDGSGLSDLDRVTPRLQVAYLAHIPTVPAARNFPLLLPANGTGTLSKMRGRYAERGVVRAKTGTLGNVAAITGYLGRADGVFIVSLIYNGGRATIARRAEWQLFRLLGAIGAVLPEDFDTPADSIPDGPDTLQIDTTAAPPIH
ncbi:MAG: D-alanyl-D-alanine carboxypeptidase/D-alanyl-D-alanine-endopeptidase [Gemmatimonadales bacterium]